MSRKLPVTYLPSPAEHDRINAVADAIAELLGVPPENVVIEGARWVSLRVEQAEQLVALARHTEEKQ